VNWILAGGVYSSELAEESMSQVLWLGGLATVLLIIGGILFLILVRKVVTVPLQQATTLAESLAVGDLSRRVETASNNEIGHMLQAMNGIGEGLSKVVAEVRSGSANIQIAAQRSRAEMPIYLHAQKFRLARSKKPPVQWKNSPPQYIRMRRMQKKQIVLSALQVKWRHKREPWSIAW
jgi:HAMP domain-containing protein